MAPPIIRVVDRGVDQTRITTSNQVQFSRDFLSFLLSRGQTGPTTCLYLLEVVWVYERFKLLDPESYQRTYTRKNGRPLAKGFYIVSWPRGKSDRFYGDEAVFHGPYSVRKVAEVNAEMFQALLQQRTGPREQVRPVVRRLCGRWGVAGQNTWIDRRNLRPTRLLSARQY